MSRFEENLAFLRGCHPALARRLESIPAARCRLETARNGQTTLAYAAAGAEALYLHSKFNPGDEAARVVAGFRLDSGHLTVLGLGLGYHLGPILDAKSPSSRVLLVEPDLEIVAASLHTLDWRLLLERGDLFVAFGPDPQTLAEAVHRFFSVVCGDSPRYAEWPAEKRLFLPFFTEARRIIENEIHTMVVDFTTRLAESDLVPRNILKNAPHLIHTRPARLLADRFAGVPGFIVGAGPSLDANLLELQAVQDRAVIISVDTALKPLLARGIQPHFTVVADPSHKNYLHLQGTERRLRHWLVAEPAVAAPVYRDFRERLFSVSIGRPLVRMIEENSQELGQIEAWGSVISLAVGLAALLALDPVVFLGQDFAFTHLRNHCRHTSWDERWLESTRELDDLQRREAQSIRGNSRVIETLDIFGRPTLTSDRLQLYKNYLARMVAGLPGTRFVNASAGGIFGEIPWRPLEAVLAEHLEGRPAIDLSSLALLPRLAPGPEPRRRLRTFFTAKRDFFQKYDRKVAEATAALARPEPGRTELELAEKVKGQLYENPQNGDIAEFWSQGPIYHFLRRSAQLDQEPAPDIAKKAGLYGDYFRGLHEMLPRIAAAFGEAAGSLDD